MKRSKRLITLVVILALVCTATFALTFYEEKQEEIKNSDAVILEISKDLVEAVSWNFTNVDLAFHKEETGWIYDNDESFPVDDDRIEAMLLNFEAFSVSFVIENAQDYGQYGLDNPEGSIQIKTENATYELKLGDYSKMDEQRYVDIGDGNVYLVSEDPADYMAETLSDVILHDETPDLEKVTDIQFFGEEDYVITYTEESTFSYSKEDNYFTEKEGKKVPVDPETISSYLDMIESLSLSNFVTYDVTEEELAAYGLKEPELSVTVNSSYIDEEEKEVSAAYVFHLGQNQEELEAWKEAKEKEKEELPAVTKYIRIGNSNIVYEVEDSIFESLIAASYDDVRHKEVFWADSESITQIDITLEGEKHVLTSKKQEGEEEERLWFFGEEEIDITDLRADLKSLVADSFTKETVDQKEEISLTVYLENEKFPQIEINLYRYNGKLCLAVVNGESVSLVERSSVMELVEAVQAIVLD